MRDDPMCQVIVSTVAFGQGFNVTPLLDSIQLGAAKTVSQSLQQGGRVGRDPTTIGRAVMLMQAAALKSAQKYLARRDSDSRKPARNSKSLTTMNNEKALMLTTTSCLNVFFNKMFGNNAAGSFLDCIARARRLPCSNCLPRFVGSIEYLPSPLPSGTQRLRPFSQPKPKPSVTQPYRPKNTKLTRKMRTAADAELRKFRSQVQKAEREYDIYGCTPPSSYLSNPVITSLLDSLLIIWTQDVLVTKIPLWEHHERHGEKLWLLISGLQFRFAAEFTAAQLEKNKKARVKRRRVNKDVMSDGDGDEETDEEDVAMDSGDDEEELEGPPELVLPPPPPRKRRALEDTTNMPPSPKRVRAAREPPKSVNATLETYGPQYKPRNRTRNVEN
ncbi:hypothetical protein B0H16DRAFT_1574678, partial [Mycena metata]